MIPIHSPASGQQPITGTQVAQNVRIVTADEVLTTRDIAELLHSLAIQNLPPFTCSETLNSVKESSNSKANDILAFLTTPNESAEIKTNLCGVSIEIKKEVDCWALTINNNPKVSNIPFNAANRLTPVLTKLQAFEAWANQQRPQFTPNWNVGANLSNEEIRQRINEFTPQERRHLRLQWTQREILLMQEAEQISQELEQIQKERQQNLKKSEPPPQ